MTSPPPCLEAPVAWDEGTRTWVIRSQRQAKAALTCEHLDVVPDPSFGVYHVKADSEQLSVAEFYGSWFSRSPRHRRIKKVLREPYSALCVPQFKQLFESVARRHAAALGDRGDLLGDFLTPFGMETTAAMLEVPEELRPQLYTAAGLITTFVKKVSGFSGREIRGMEMCVRFLRFVVDRLFELPAPGPIVASLVEIARSDDAGRWLAVTTLGQLLAAGVEPMTTGAAVACRQLFGDRVLFDGVVGGGVAVEDVAEEALRLDPPFLYIHRWAQQPCPCLGPVIQPGCHVVIDVRAVNRDPTIFDSPTSFDPSRPHHLNLTFGRGTHYCLGIASGRLQIAEALRALVALDPPVEVDPAAVDVRDEDVIVVARSIPFCRGDVA